MSFALRFRETSCDQPVNDRIPPSTFPDRRRNKIVHNAKEKRPPLYRQFSSEQGGLSLDRMRRVPARPQHGWRRHAQAIIPA